MKVERLLPLTDRVLSGRLKLPKLHLEIDLPVFRRSSRIVRFESEELILMFLKLDGLYLPYIRAHPIPFENVPRARRSLIKAMTLLHRLL